jgi:poly(A)-specific ribonuclease
VTGANIPNLPKPNKFDRPEERYVQSKRIPERYSIVQVGISLFHENPAFKKQIKRALRSSSNQQNQMNEEEHEENNNNEVKNDVVGGLQSGSYNEDDGDINAMPRSNQNEELSDYDESSTDSSVSLSNSHQNRSDDADADEDPIDRDNDNLMHPIALPPIPGIPANLNIHLPMLPINVDIGHPQRDRDAIRGVQNNLGNFIEPPEFLVRNYNFYLAPSSKLTSREILLNPSSIEYLKDQNIDFNTWLNHGIPFISLEGAKSSLMNFSSEQKDNNVDDQDLEWEEPTDAQDVAFIARSMASLREWIDSAAPNASRRLGNNLSLGDEQRLGIARVIPFPKKESLKACLRGKIKYEYPSLHWENHHNQHVLVRLNDTEKKLREERKKRVAWRQMYLDNIGFTRVLKALSSACKGELETGCNLDSEYKAFEEHEKNGTIHEFIMKNMSQSDCTESYRSKKCRRVPIIVHNGFMDFLYLLSYFHDSKLPSTYEEVKDLVHGYFPIVYDTKVLGTEFSNLPRHRNNSCLTELYKDFVIQDDIVIEGDFIVPEIPQIRTPSVRLLNDRSEATMLPQEADHSYMIGTVFQCLTRRLKIATIENDAATAEINTALECFYKSIISAKKSKVGSLLFLDENHPEIKSASPLYGMNCIFLQNSIFVVDLAAVSDPLKSGYSASSIFRVSCPNHAAHIEDINQIVKKMRSQELNGRVQYEVGVTPTYFIIAGKTRALDRQEVLKNVNCNNAQWRSNLLRSLLKAKFPNDLIVSLEDILIGNANLPWTTSGMCRNDTTRRVVRPSFLSRIIEKIRISKRAHDNPQEHDNKRSRI